MPRQLLLLFLPLLHLLLLHLEQQPASCSCSLAWCVMRCTLLPPALPLLLEVLCDACHELALGQDSLHARYLTTCLE